ncbi:PhaM family polyhydroxyalkanoate granule multifunctional regulatory protein [Aquariibacter albus]|uniref:Uncharacterized protein n=1 Tax=Aquariibacter albus TaxID=2759899 RepID=A0A839HKA2_9BURK|nr:PhaM family polyhydroxyalkanoate granule multifunctional regulatory protein [Aquariibacter albus]MBB1162905.1 hypothetical protein [Aquariibacter albus]
MASNAPDFSTMVPGFDFLQTMIKGASSALPGVGQWVAPTLDPQELEKRIEELRTVQFWLEQNARLIGTTIQALEVQRMTLSTLKTMNVQVADLREALRIKPIPPTAPAAAATPPAAEPEAAPASEAAPKLIDPTQWWSALTQQFTEIATQAVKDAAVDPAKLMQQGLDAAGQTLQAGLAPAREAVEAVARSAGARRAKAGPSSAEGGSDDAPAASARPARKPAAKRAAPAAGDSPTRRR